jgi:hypothetical protein
VKAANSLGFASRAIAVGATTPVPGEGVGAAIWSTSATAVLVWSGSAWAYTGLQTLNPAFTGTLIGAITATGVVTGSANIGSGLPAQAATSGSWSLAWNFSAGNGEVVAVNNYWAAVVSFTGIQRTAAGTQQQVYKFNPDGSLYLGVAQDQVATRPYAAATYAPIAAALDNIGRNLLHNARFRINARNNANVTANLGYVADRWQHGDAAGTGSRTLTLGVLSDADRAAIGDEDAVAYVNIATTAGSAASDYEVFSQSIESVRKLSGKTVTWSFWAKATTAGNLAVVEMLQLFGTGGTPSANVTGLGITRLTLTTSWVRYSGTVAIPSASGKTFGTTAGTDFSQFVIWTSGGATYNARNGTLGEQTSTIQLTGMQLEVGSAASQLEKLDMPEELNDCQRFFQAENGTLSHYAAAAAALNYASLPMKTKMRVNPTVVVTPSGGGNFSSVTAAGNTGTVVLTATATAAGIVSYNWAYTAAAEFT